jgi:FkbM family methyltransferase
MSIDTPLDRRSSIIGAVIGLIVGGAAGFVSGKSIEADTMTAPAPAASSAPKVARPATSGSAGVPLSEARPSFAQQGEDIVMQEMLFHYGVRQPTYLDIGAHDPIRGSNTYLFYAVGSHGVLVEPNPHYVEKLKRVRPSDTVLEVGVGVDDQAEADYYLVNGDGQLNTFSKRQADSLVRVHHRKIEGVIKRKLVPINRILEDNFKEGAPDILSIDVEGLDFDILRTLDWTRWRPKVVCVETSQIETGLVDRRIVELLEKNGYSVRGGSLVNTIFLDDRVSGAADAGAPASGGDGGR